jgi:hypothetical protein
VTLLGSTLLNVGGTSACPFPLHTGPEIIGFAYFQATSSLAFLALLYVTFMTVQLIRALSWLLVLHSSACARCCGSCTRSENEAAPQRCSLLRRVIAHAFTRQAFQRSFLAFVMTSYEPFCEVTLQFMACVEVGGVQLVARRPEVRCDSNWHARFIPALLIIIAVPAALFFLLADELNKAYGLRRLCKRVLPGSSSAAASSRSSSSKSHPQSAIRLEEAYVPLVDASDSHLPLSDSPQIPASPHSGAAQGHAASADDNDPDSHSVITMLSHHFEDR